MFSTSLRRGLLSGRAAQMPFAAPCMMASQTSLLGMAPSAGFAKYQRNKPHLNVGTIGKYPGGCLSFKRAITFPYSACVKVTLITVRPP